MQKSKVAISLENPTRRGFPEEAKRIREHYRREKKQFDRRWKLRKKLAALPRRDSGRIAMEDWPKDLLPFDSLLPQGAALHTYRLSLAEENPANFDGPKFEDEVAPTSDYVSRFPFNDAQASRSAERTRARISEEIESLFDGADLCFLADAATTPTADGKGYWLFADIHQRARGMRGHKHETWPYGTFDEAAWKVAGDIVKAALWVHPGLTPESLAQFCHSVQVKEHVETFFESFADSVNAADLAGPRRSWETGSLSRSAANLAIRLLRQYAHALSAFNANFAPPRDAATTVPEPEIDTKPNPQIVGELATTEARIDGLKFLWIFRIAMEREAFSVPLLAKVVQKKLRSRKGCDVITIRRIVTGKTLGPSPRVRNAIIEVLKLNKSEAETVVAELTRKSRKK